MKSGAVEKGKKEGGITVFFLINAPGTDKNEIKSLSIFSVILHLFFFKYKKGMHNRGSALIWKNMVKMFLYYQSTDSKRMGGERRKGKERKGEEKRGEEKKREERKVRISCKSPEGSHHSCKSHTLGNI